MGRTPVLRTVLGDVEPAEMGFTLSHEHLVCDSSSWFRRPTREDDLAYVDAEPALDNLWWMRQHPNSNRRVLRLDDENLAVEELRQFRHHGGSTVIELTATGLGRDAGALARIAAQTGLHIVAATGLYVEKSHPSWVRGATVDDLTERFVSEIEYGIDGSAIRAGVIGEIGLSEPIGAGERKALQAAARAQQRTGAAISVHTAAHATEADTALRALEILAGEDADLSCVVMGHMDTTLHRPTYHRAVLELGCMLEFDLFGHEFFESENDFVCPGDLEKTRAVAALVQAGFRDQLLLSHDVCYKIQLQHYGGYGYAHLLRNILPRFVLEGVPAEVVVDILTRNPRRVFPLGSASS